MRSPVRDRRSSILKIHRASKAIEGETHGKQTRRSLNFGRSHLPADLGYGNVNRERFPESWQAVEEEAKPAIFFREKPPKYLRTDRRRVLGLVPNLVGKQNTTVPGKASPPTASMFQPKLEGESSALCVDSPDN